MTQIGKKPRLSSASAVRLLISVGRSSIHSSGCLSVVLRMSRRSVLPRPSMLWVGRGLCYGVACSVRHGVASCDSYEDTSPKRFHLEPDCDCERTRRLLCSSSEEDACDVRSLMGQLGTCQDLARRLL